ncbi:tripartite tricarboxylate transporter substrate-binding protein [Roseomonas sp. GCM10028921]
MAAPTSSSAPSPATVAAARSPDLPELPTLIEAGVDAPVMPGWLALIGPAGMPEAVVALLNTASRDALADPALLRIMATSNIVPIPGSADDIRKRVVQDGNVWGGFIRAKGLRVE